MTDAGERGPDGGEAADLSARKGQIRADALSRRDALTAAYRAASASALTDHAEMLLVAAGTIVSGFWPIRSEIDPRPLMDALAARGATIALPAVVDRTTIIFRRYDPSLPLEPAGFGTMAPGADAETLDPDVMLIPLSAFDAQGNRIGYGAGHYDRAIARLHAAGRQPRLIGVAFQCQCVASVPRGSHDVPLHTVLTENGLQNFAAQR